MGRFVVKDDDIQQQITRLKLLIITAETKLLLTTIQMLLTELQRTIARQACRSDRSLMLTPALLERFKASSIDFNRLDGWRRTTYEVFDFRQSTNPAIDVTIQLDITEARADYARRYSSMDGASFNLYLYWRLLQSLYAIPEFNQRQVQGHWVQFDNLPFHCAVDLGSHRVRLVVLEDVKGCTFQMFCQKFHASVEKQRRTPDDFNMPDDIPLDVLPICHYITVLPELEFTAYHASNRFWPHFCYVLGKRYEQDGLLKTPFYMRAHHAPCNPYFMSMLVRYFNEFPDTLSCDATRATSPR